MKLIPTIRDQGKCGGFSLIEIFAVLTIISLLLTMSVLGINNIADSADLTSSGDQLVNYLVQARQKSLADNATVEVRFYPPVAGEERQRWMILLSKQNSDGSSIAVQRPLLLNESITISETPAFSTLIAHGQRKTDDRLVLTDEQRLREFFSFRFRPDGSTNLPQLPDGDTWHLTAFSRKHIESSGNALPSNFYTVRVDPITGGVRTYRP